MKQLIKSILKKLGVLNEAKVILHKIKYNKYKNHKRWVFNHCGLKLQFLTTDEYSRNWFYPRYAKGKIHEPTATNIFVNNVKTDSIVLDIGANLGYFSCIAAKLATNGRVYSFDVDPKCSPLIKANLKLNFLQNTMVINSALSDHNGTVKIKNLDSPNPGIVIDSSNPNNTIEIKSTTLDDFVAAHDIKPNFIKIDVEGAEGKVLKGMTEVLELEDLIILVEIHVNHLRKYFNTDYKDLILLLLQKGFQLERIDHRLRDSGFRRVNLSTVLEGNTMLICRK